MKKIMIVLLAGVLFAPAFAAENAAVAQTDKRPEMAQKKGEFLKAQKEHRAKMEATEKKMENLVKEYGKLKGKKQEAKKAEIAAEVERIHEEQLKFKQAQLDQFARRLEEMKKLFEEENSETGKKAWVEKKTDELIKAEGDLGVLFDGPKGKSKDHMRGPKGKKGKGFFKKGFGRKGPEDDGRVGINPPPPPPLEEK
ncbi:MAG: hypothetical protein IKO35_00810 [Elusimicrobiaceae bacterium]|nr:hypothetical protein [Elusimicrobiaceae bacterium]